MPHVYSDLCTGNVVVMEWIEGVKLGEALLDPSCVEENLRIIQDGLMCTMSQLLDTRIMHADPHGGNLMKVKELSEEGETVTRLGYIDFGLLSTVPLTVRDALVCAVAYLIFARDVPAVASMFGELQLLEGGDPALAGALQGVLDQTMVYSILMRNTLLRSLPSDSTSCWTVLSRFFRALNLTCRLTLSTMRGP